MTWDLKSIVTLLVVAGTLALFPMMIFLTVPADNKDLWNFVLGAWVGSGFTIVMKRLFDSTESSDMKNATIATLATATAAAQSAPVPPKADSQ